MGLSDSRASGGVIVIGAHALAEILGLPMPTEEQRAVIEAPMNSQVLVVAGAGSGKTETMSQRVLWLVANGHMHADEILGLTFSRKATSELATRIRERIMALAHHQLVPKTVASVENNSDSATNTFAENFANVTTYNAFAAGIFRENALLIGREPETQVIGTAAAWQIARAIVAESTDSRLIHLDMSPERITDAVLKLSGHLSGNVADPADVKDFAEEFLRARTLPLGSARARNSPENVTKALDVVDALPPLVDLAERFALEKTRRGLTEFSDQVSLALTICVENTEIVTSYRQRFRAVLLDEYQDTDVLQSRLLSTLFRGTSVMAVGDPDQAIYGWRGASEANLARFHEDFGGSTAIEESIASDGKPISQEPRITLELSTSWRNPELVLDAANIISKSAKRNVRKADLVAAPNAAPGDVAAYWGQTLEDEAFAVSQWFANRVSEGSTAALILRSRTHAAIFEAALREQNVPVHLLGFAPLLDQPVVADLICALRVLRDPTAGSELIRLLGGARWRIGAADLLALNKLAHWLEDRNHAAALLDSDAKVALRRSTMSEESVSIVDALDAIATLDADHRALLNFSREGLERLRRAATQLQSLRRRAVSDLSELVHLCTQELLLDIEIAANPSQILARASLDAIDDHVAQYVMAAEHPTLDGFLDWLDEAERRDNLSPRAEDPEPGAVQILTIHAAKGLEWDYVAVPQCVQSTRLDGTKGWLSVGELPYELRGDAEELPELEWREVETQYELKAAIEDFQAKNKVRGEEENRRLSYVAFTRPKKELLLSGSWWSNGKKPTLPSEQLLQLVAAGIIAQGIIPAFPEVDSNPRAFGAERISWPLNPLGAREKALREVAEQVEHYLDDASLIFPSNDADALMGREIAREIEILIAERDTEKSTQLQELPIRIPVSQVEHYLTSATEALSNRARPMPVKPQASARLGTAFHKWVQDRNTSPPPTLEFDFDDDSAIEIEQYLDDRNKRTPIIDKDEASLAAFRATFLESPWCDRKANAVELELHLPLCGQIFVCKIDAIYEAGTEFDAKPDIIEGSDVESLVLSSREKGSSVRKTMFGDLAAKGMRAQIVDWKTGALPGDEEELERRGIQLELYRLAYAEWAKIPVDKVDAVFYYLASDTIVRPRRRYDRETFCVSWGSVLSSFASPAYSSPVALSE